jgi:drug/metabolite transporter (DMT)-like permease
MTNRATGVGLAFIAAAISGVSVFLNGYAVRAFGDPTVYTTVKNLISAVLLGVIAIALASRGSSVGFTMPRTIRERIGLLAVGVFGGGLAFALFFQGLAQTSSTGAAFTQKTLVIWVAVLAVVFLRERFGWPHVAAIALLVVGQAAASGGVGGFALDQGQAMVFAATLLWSIEVVIAKPLLRGLSPLTVATARMGIGVFVLTAIVLVTGVAASVATVSAEGWLWVVVTGVILTGYVGTWYAALARAQAIDVTAVLVFAAVITAILSSGVRGVSIAPSATGLGLVTVGTLLIAWLAMRRRPTVT